MSSYSYSESSIIKVNKTASVAKYYLFESEFSFSFTNQALSLLPSGDVFLYLDVHYGNPFITLPNITYKTSSKIFTVIFFDENFN